MKKFHKHKNKNMKKKQEFCEDKISSNDETKKKTIKNDVNKK